MIYQLWKIEEATYLRNKRETMSAMPRGLSMAAWRLEHGRFTTMSDNSGQRYQRIAKRIGKTKHVEYKIAKVGRLPKVPRVHTAALGVVENEADRPALLRAARTSRKEQRRLRREASNPGFARYRAAKESARKARRHARRAAFRSQRAEARAE